ncbi:hypothetical protein PG996_013741 [Apiospora saccharicola]|uniref:Uncharacterized protein n=1 Tax=Apiospora saccharicola TaxID=335842 RepID=A0ABR1TGD9_9PEZI
MTHFGVLPRPRPQHRIHSPALEVRVLRVLPPRYTDQEFRAQAAPVTALMSDGSRLPDPVVIPQRRPKDRTRGFARAYAPDLSRCGIDQGTFLRFIDGLNASVAASGAVQAINLAGAAAGAVPASVFIGAPIIGLALQVGAGIYTEVTARKGYDSYISFSFFLLPAMFSSYLSLSHGTGIANANLAGRCSQNAFLTKMNDELFRPRGLYCLIMSYDINSRANVTRPGQGHDPSKIIQKGMSSASTSRGMRSNDGILGAANFPATAQLVYPDPDDPPVHDFDDDSSSSSYDGQQQQQPGPSGGSKFSNMLASFAEKRDFKTQVKFQKKNPTSLINPLMDPKAELSDKDLRKQRKREAKQERKDDKREHKSEKRERKGKAAKVRKIKEVLTLPTRPAHLIPLATKLLTDMVSTHQGVLYLMIVNMPSNQDMQTAHHLVGDPK